MAKKTITIEVSKLKKLIAHANVVSTKLNEWIPDGFGMEDEIKACRDSIETLSDTIDEIQKEIEE